MKTEIRRLHFYKEAADIFTMYRNREMAVFLDSALENQLGRYSVIGLYPYIVLREENGICYRNGEKQPESFEKILDEELQKRKEKNPTELPLTGGAIGYFSYDYGRKFEQIHTRHANNAHIYAFLCQLSLCSHCKLNLRTGSDNDGIRSFLLGIL